MPWYKEWFGEEYLELYSYRDESEAEEHVDFVERQLGDGAAARPRAVLDLACGAGRHTAALRRRGYRTLGVDLSITLLARMREQGLPRVAGDMRRLPFADGSFDWVLNFFTSFGYFEAERENFRVLEEIVRVLTPGGRFLIDLMNPGPVLANLKPRDVEVREDGLRVEIERWYDPERQRINKRIVRALPRRRAAHLLRKRAPLPARGGDHRPALGGAGGRRPASAISMETPTSVTANGSSSSVTSRPEARRGRSRGGRPALRRCPPRSWPGATSTSSRPCASCRPAGSRRPGARRRPPRARGGPRGQPTAATATRRRPPRPPAGRPRHPRHRDRPAARPPRRAALLPSRRWSPPRAGPRRSKRPGEPAVAVFWVATEDHDWAEVSSATVLAPDGAEDLRPRPRPGAARAGGHAHPRPGHRGRPARARRGRARRPLRRVAARGSAAGTGRTPASARRSAA